MNTRDANGFRPTECKVCRHRNKFGRSKCSFCGRPLPSWNTPVFWVVVLGLLALVIAALL